MGLKKEDISCALKLEIENKENSVNNKIFTAYVVGVILPGSEENL